MTKHSKNDESRDHWQSLRRQVLGLGEHSFRKSYYPELQKQLGELSRFRTLLDNSIDAIVLVELPRGVIVDFNQSLLRLLRTSKEELQKNPEFERWFGTDLLEHIRQQAPSDLPLTEPRTTKGTQITIDDSPVDIQATVGLTRLENKTFAAVVLRDVTYQRLTEKKLLVAQKLESVAQLAGGIAHDFNNLLSAINGYAELINMRPDDPNKVREFSGEIMHAGNLASNLTRKILAFSKKQALVPQPFGVNRLVEDMKTTLLRLLGENIELLTNLAADPDVVEADIGQLEQVVMNLSVNARDAMPQGGTLVIETHKITLSRTKQCHTGTLDPGPYLVLAVTDTGVGMDDATKARIFEPFFTTKKKKGTGLGLLTIYGIVKQSGGGIDVHSAPNKGSKFEIFLPTSAKFPSAKKPDIAPSARLAGTETILLVEDDATVRNYVWRVLETYGYRVLVATNGVEALRLTEASNLHVDLLLTDVVMPLMDGTKVYKRLEKTYPGVGVVFMTGYVELRDEKVNELDLPKYGRLVTKPFKAATLLQAIRDCVEGRE